MGEVKVGDKVVVTDVPEGFGVVGIGVGSVGEVVSRFDGTYVNILFGDGRKLSSFVDEGEYFKSKNRGFNHLFLVEKFDNKEEEVMLEVGDKVVVTEVLHDALEGVEVGKVGEIIAVDYSIYTKLPYLVNFGDFKWWAGRDFLVEKLEDVETGETPPEEEIKGVEMRRSVNVKEDDVGEALTVKEVIKQVIEENARGIKPDEALTTNKDGTSEVGEDFWANFGQGSALGGTGIYIEEKQGTKESDNSPLGGAYNTVIEKDGLTIYTNYSVEVVEEVMRVGGVDDLVSHFDESEEGSAICWKWFLLE